MFDFRQITLFCLEKRFSKHKITTFSKNFGGAMDPLTPLATSMVRGVGWFALSNESFILIYFRK